MHGFARFQAKCRAGMAWLALAALALGCVAADAATRYVATPLGTLGGTYSNAAAINNHGQVAGSAQTAGDAAWHAFVHDGRAMIDLGTLGGRNSYGADINDRGWVTGGSELANGRRHAFLYASGAMADVGGLDAVHALHYCTSGLGINESGQIAGVRDFECFLTDINAIVIAGGGYLPLFSIGVYSLARDINDAGQVTGVGQMAAGARAFLYTGSAMLDLGTLGGETSNGVAINARGEVAGVSAVAGGKHRPFVYRDGRMTDLGTFGGDYGVGASINDRGQIVGWSDAAGGSRAFLHVDGALLDLNGLVASGLGGATLTHARGINNRGQVVADSCDPMMNCRAFRLDPIVDEVPTVSQQALVALGILLAVVAALRLRRRT